MRYFSFLAVFVWIALIPARAVQDADGSFSNFSAPTDLDIANWDSGGGTNPAGVTGWNYVGLITIPEGFLSGVYLGNGYVLTAAHGGTTFDNFTLNGVSYTPVTGSVQTFTTFGDGTGGQADLLLFKIAKFIHRHLRNEVELVAAVDPPGDPIGQICLHVFDAHARQPQLRFAQMIRIFTDQNNLPVEP